MRFYESKSVAQPAPLYRPRRNSPLVALGGKIGMAVGVFSRLAPLAIKGYGRYLMRGGLFGVLADLDNRAKAKSSDDQSQVDATLAKSALLAQLFQVMTSKKPGKGGSIKSTLLRAGLEKALPILALVAANALNRKRP